MSFVAPEGQRFVGINGAPQFKFDEAVSFQVNCDDQDEIDYFWEKRPATWRTC